jgi:hypothetical protein
MYTQLLLDQVLNKLPPNALTEDNREVLNTLDNFQCKIFLNLEFKTNNSAEDYTEMLNIISDLCEDRHGTMFNIFSKDILKEPKFIKKIHRSNMNFLSLLKIIDQDNVTAEDIFAMMDTEFEVNLDYIQNLITHRIKCCWNSLQLILNRQSSPEIASLFLNLKSDEQCENNLAIIENKHFSYSKLMAFTFLTKEERTFNLLEKILESSDEKLDTFNFLFKNQRTLENLNKIFRISDEQAMAFNLLPHDERDLKALNIISNISELQAKAFCSLPETQRIFENINTFNALSNIQAQAFISILPKSNRILSTVNECLKLTDSQANCFNSLNDSDHILFYLNKILKLKDLQTNNLYLLLKENPESVVLDDFLMLTDSTSDNFKNIAKQSSYFAYNIFLEASLNSLLKQEILPEEYKNLSPFISKTIIITSDAIGLKESLSAITIYSLYFKIPTNLDSIFVIITNIFTPKIVEVLCFYTLFKLPYPVNIGAAASLNFFNLISKKNNNVISFNKILEHMIEDNSDPISIGSLTYTVTSILAIQSSTSLGIAISASIATDYIISSYAQSTLTAKPSFIEYSEKILLYVTDGVYEYFDNKIAEEVILAGEYS